jgi:CRP/FNR family transcriptional regulator, anaerobic regulatory protein
MNESTSAMQLFPFCRQLSERGTMDLRAGMTHTALEAGKVVLQQGDEVSGVFLVRRGSLRIYYVTPEGREGTLYWVLPGQSCILALNCTFSLMPYPAWVEADRGPTEVSIIPGGLFRRLFDAEPAVQRFAFDALCGQLQELMSELHGAMTRGLEQRLARLLLALADGSGVVLMSQERLAQHLGTAREVVSRALRNLASSGRISLSPRTITIVDRQGLLNSAGLLDAAQSVAKKKTEGAI